jgi:hypothetical protein
MEILQRFFDVIPLIGLVGYAIAASLTKDDAKEIKYLLWATLFVLSGIADTVVNV